MPNFDLSQEFTRFMQAHQDRVFSTALRLLGQRAPAEDLAQEVFLKAYENFSMLRHSDAAGGWLKTVTTHLALNYLSRHRRRWRLFSELAEADWAELPALPESVLQQVADQQRQAFVEQALLNLPDRYRVPLVLFHFEALAYEQIAQHLNISLAKVKMDLYRGRALLAARLVKQS